MTRRRETFSGPLSTSQSEFDLHDLSWPFGKLDGLTQNDIREAAYEIFFTACRSSPGFGGKNALSFYSHHENSSDGLGSGSGFSPRAPGSGTGLMLPTSRVKRALGLRMIKRLPSRRMSSIGVHSSPPSSPSKHNGGGHSPGGYAHTMPASRPRRPMTSAEIMRQQMRVTHQSDNRLRKTLLRSLVGQSNKRVETVVLPLELIRHLKPSEFNDPQEYHQWQKRQLKILEIGLLLFPTVPLQKGNASAKQLREIIKSTELKPLDTGKYSEALKTLSNSVTCLAWRGINGLSSEVCHWADGYPLNINIYLTLLRSIFDLRDETQVLDEVDELLELMKKTWSILGITRPVHNICFAWVLFHQHVSTSQLEPDLVYACHVILKEVENDARKQEKEATYMNILPIVLSSMLDWSEKRLLNYHEYFNRGTASSIEHLIPLVYTASKLLGKDLKIAEVVGKEIGNTKAGDPYEECVGHCIRSSVNNAFQKKLEMITETRNFSSSPDIIKVESTDVLLQLGKEMEDLAITERDLFSPVLKKWYPVAAGLAAVNLHSQYGAVLKQYLSRMATISSDTVEVLQGAGKLEKVLVQMVVEDTADCEDGGKCVVREMIPYEVDSIILTLLGQWTEERLKKGKECLLRAKETETWNPKSKTEPYSQSAVELMTMAQGTTEDFFNIPIGITEDLVYDLADGLERLFQEYTTFVASCGSKQSYMPTLPPLTRCNQHSKISKLLKIVPCNSAGGAQHLELPNDGHHHPRPSTSRGTQRLYIRLNTLHFLLSHLQALDKTLSLSSKIIRSHPHNRRHSSSYFEMSFASIQAACQHVSEVAAYRLVFLDSNSVFYDSLYAGDVANSRIRPALRILKQNLTLLCAILVDKAQPVAVKEVMKASFEAFLMVLLAGGSSRVFHRSDHEIVREDFESLKRVFWTCGEGILSEEVVNREAESVDGVIELMGQCTEQLMEDFSIATCEKSGIGVLGGSQQKLPMPPTTGRWNQTDPNTILRVLCHRNDRAANQFLKRMFQLAKRR